LGIPHPSILPKTRYASTSSQIESSSPRYSSLPRYAEGRDFRDGVKAALPAMQPNSHIVLVSSGAGLIGVYGYSAYSLSKFAVRGLAESLRGELKGLGVGISIIYPPDTDTPQLAEENKTKPPATKLITATAKVWSAEAVAKEIVKGIEKKPFAIAPGLELTILNKFHSLIAPGLNYYFDRLIAKSK